MLQACLNGGRTRDFHAAVPFTAAELAQDAAQSVAAGAQELHVHPRGADGAESLEPDDVAEAILAIRTIVPGVPVGLSTHWRIPPGGKARQSPIEQWTVLPDYVSINLVEEDAAEMISLVLGKGMGVEAGLWSVSDAERFIGLPDAAKCLRILIEINEQEAQESLAAATGIISVLEHADFTLPILLHGDEASVWPMFREAMARGYDSRIGLEDGRLLPSGTKAADNADIVRAAVLLARVY
ncbi:3-keto-5-aminohexanoate cleavage protein [Phyllobacterium zundukense]|uniref:3-keto-5-aminohexanoate cleavage protein n=1 Tax=Phyllobacterium zundukense TaxID=1867719 RepID=A0ACD4D2L5_9HYPH|nr:3-keto-5-aminohexanoate cleavage protein [Phyllobacterium zundukense]UXN60028.1 3-keto-5-aminohexanoate cleavage protein [Phyllobacterium zundukense]